ncbi:C6 transcription factor, putative [Rhizoctonia solani]|uniref:C6 transcription factor, putative n=1 Tax=Rhizoctonia solani TaxID=456999 RepID=A0A0K6G106_9AGAM|nr:unnamed protein product [Rhizoctonia solani]CUA72044.1 C6 transcription factor, putative [Rhizoctonia solani]
MPSSESRRSLKSCLTCRQWRVKCDLSKPNCETCLKGGLECLGYDVTKPRAHTHRESPRVLILPRLQPVTPAAPAQIESSKVVDFTAPTPSSSPRPSILETAVVYRMTAVPTLIAEDNDSDCSWPQQDRSASYQTLSTHQSSKAENFLNMTSCTQPNIHYLTRAIEILCKSIPATVNATQMVREARFVCIIHEYQVQRARFRFMTPPVATRDSLIVRLNKSNRWIWTLLLAAKLLQSLSQDPCGTVRGHLGWIDQFEKTVALDSSSASPLDDLPDRLSAQLELMYLTFLTVDIASGYIRLQKVLSNFLRLVATDPTLYIEHPNGNLVVSLPRTLSAPHNEFKRFLMSDNATALLLGVPPLVEYGYDGECDPVSHAIEWIHGVPVIFSQAVAQVNSWRAGSRVVPLDDWQALERRVLAWQPRIVVLDGEDSGTGNVARLAVQESWRHAVLIYIYMGMCGVSSHDSRVQASTGQIVQLGETVGNLPIGIHMFPHCVIMRPLYAL